MPIEPNPYDRPDLLDLRKNQGDPIVLYIIVRKSLGMDVGKIAAQVGHGVGMLLGRYHDFESLQMVIDREYLVANRWKIDITKEWLASSYRKVVLEANDKDWERLKEQLDVFLVKDAGLTEVDPGSETVLIPWPMKKSEAPKIIQRLQVLKTRVPGV
jgi:PTH2 family peptidyl-tRNA hydrolase